MKRTISPIPILGLLAFLLVCLIVPAQAAEPGQDRPTAPPPPIGGETQPPEPQPTQPPSSGGGERTPTRPAQTYPTRTPGASPTPSLTPTIWLTPTATITPTLAPTLTPTPILSFVDVQVYMDINRNSLFDDNEGVEQLWVTLQAGNWKSGALTMVGMIHFLLPVDLPERSEIQVQIPYLHISKIVRSPDLGETSTLEIRLDVPEYPVYLP